MRSLVSFLAVACAGTLLLFPPLASGQGGPVVSPALDPYLENPPAVSDSNEPEARTADFDGDFRPRAGSGGGGRFHTGYGEPRFTSGDAEERRFWLDQSARANSSLARIRVRWSAVAPSPPVDAANPGDPAYRFDNLDGAVRDAAARGHRIVLMLYHAPAWAEGPNRPAPSGESPSGTWKPRPGAFRDFAQAVASRYSGAFPAPGAAALPRARFLIAWNEPNLTEYLTPQSVNNKLFAPRHYRKMLNAFSAGVANSANPKAKVVAGTTSPYGDPVGGRRTRPLRFLRELLCVNGRLRPKNRCPGGKARFDILSHHPITLSGGPNQSAVHRDDISMPDFKKVVRVLRAAENRNTVRENKRHPAWATEFWWETNPPDSVHGVPLRKHARWVQRSLHSLWKQGAGAAIWFQLVDASGAGSGPIQTGHFFADRTEKPAFQAFRFPFHAKRQNRKKVKVWTIAPGNGKVVVKRKRGKNWRKVKGFKVRSGVPKQTRVRVRGKAKLRVELRGEASLPSGVKRR